MLADDDWLNRSLPEGIAKELRELAIALRAPLVIFSVVDRDHVWLCLQESSGSLASDQYLPSPLPRQDSFCTHVIDSQRLWVLPDALEQPLLAHSPLVQRYGVRAYLGAPLMGVSGYCLGAIAVLDFEPRRYSELEARLVQTPAHWVMACLDLEQGKSRGQSAKIAANLPNQLIAERLERLQTPLLTVTGLTTMLQRELYGPLNSKQQEYLGAVLRGGTQMLLEIEHNLELRDVLNTPTPSQPIAVDAVQVLQQLLDELTDLTQPKHIRLELNRSGLHRQGLARLEGFRCMLRLVLRTLLETTPPHSQLQLRVALPNHQFQLICHANQALPLLRQAWQTVQRRGQDAVRVSPDPTTTALTLVQELLAVQQGSLSFESPLGSGDRLLLNVRFTNIPGATLAGKPLLNPIAPSY
jgi:signal transduction histidine kinase